MYKRISNVLTVFASSILCILFTSCANEITRTQNNPPVIVSISFSPLSVIVNSDITLSAVVTDDKGDEISFHWSAGGLFIFESSSLPPDFNPDTAPKANERNPTTWRPLAPGEHSIILNISDGRNAVADTISIVVVAQR